MGEKDWWRAASSNRPNASPTSLVSVPSKTHAVVVVSQLSITDNCSLAFPTSGQFPGFSIHLRILVLLFSPLLRLKSWPSSWSYSCRFFPMHYYFGLPTTGGLVILLAWHEECYSVIMSLCVKSKRRRQSWNAGLAATDINSSYALVLASTSNAAAAAAMIESGPCDPLFPLFSWRWTDGDTEPTTDGVAGDCSTGVVLWSGMMVGIAVLIYNIPVGLSVCLSVMCCDCVYVFDHDMMSTTM